MKLNRLTRKQAKKISYEQKIKEVKKWYPLTFRRRKNLSRSQKIEVSKKFDRILFVKRYNEKHKNNHRKFVHVAGAQRATNDKRFVTKKGAFIQVPLRAKNVRVRKGTHGTAEIVYIFRDKVRIVGGKKRFREVYKRKFRKDIFVSINAVELIKNPKKYVDKIKNDLEIKGEISGIMMMINGFEQRNPYEDEKAFYNYLTKYPPMTSRFKQLIENRRALKETITGLKFVTIERDVIKRKKKIARRKKHRNI